jgi:hypothetical protein
MLDRPLCEGIPVSKLSRFYSCPSRSNSLKSVRGFDIWQFGLALCLQNLWYVKVKKLGTLGFIVGVFLPRKFMFVVENFKNFSQLKLKKISFPAVVPRRENFILFHFISYMLLALQGTAGYISQSNKQEGKIT